MKPYIYISRVQFNHRGYYTCDICGANGVVAMKCLYVADHVIPLERRCDDCLLDNDPWYNYASLPKQLVSQIYHYSKKPDGAIVVGAR